jgi:hypothetical protein
MNIEEIIPEFTKLNITFKSIKETGRIDIENMKFINEFYNKFLDISNIETTILKTINNSQFSLLLNSLEIEIKTNISYYDMWGDSTQDIANYSTNNLIELTIVENEIKKQTDITNEAFDDLNEANHRLDMSGYGYCSHDEELLLQTTYNKLYSVHKSEQSKLDGLYNEQKELKFVSQEFRHNFHKIYDIDKELLIILKKYLECRKKAKENDIKSPPTNTPTRYFNMLQLSKVHSLCNKTLFENINDMDFYNIMNLSTNRIELRIKKGCKSRVCYLIFRLEIYVREKYRAKWKENILHSVLKIDDDFYSSHYKDPVSNDRSNKNEEFEKKLNILFNDDCWIEVPQ